MDESKNPMASPVPPAAKTKPLVHYRALVFCKIGASALVMPLDHPSAMVSNTSAIMTSPVVAGPDAQGRFETLNTRYEPAPKLRL